tara:strand:+ start:846 stop:1007 length:162 start_codon:yes stop_codon:yes gene_type:complete
MDLKDTILDLKNKIKSKFKINIVKFNDKILKTYKFQKVPDTIFFPQKSFIIIF